MPTISTSNVAPFNVFTTNVVNGSNLSALTLGSFADDYDWSGIGWLYDDTVACQGHMTLISDHFAIGGHCATSLVENDVIKFRATNGTVVTGVVAQVYEIVYGLVLIRFISEISETITRVPICVEVANLIGQKAWALTTTGAVLVPTITIVSSVVQHNGSVPSNSSGFPGLLPLSDGGLTLLWEHLEATYGPKPEHYLDAITDIVEDFDQQFRTFTPSTGAYDFYTSGSVVLPNLVHYWPLNEVSNGSVAVTRVDVHGSADLTDSGTTPSSTTSQGVCSDHTAANLEYLSNVVPSLNAATKASIRARMRRASASHQTAVGVRQAAAYRFGILVASNGLVYATCAGGTDAYGSCTNPVPLNEFGDYVVTFDGGGATNADRLKLYINGNLQTLNFGAFTIPTVLATTNLHGSFMVGRTFGSYTTGQYQGVGVWDEAISQQVVTTLYGGGISPEYPFLEAEIPAPKPLAYQPIVQVSIGNSWPYDDAQHQGYQKWASEFGGYDGLGEFLRPYMLNRWKRVMIKNPGGLHLSAEDGYYRKMWVDQWLRAKAKGFSYAIDADLLVFYDYLVDAGVEEIILYIGTPHTLVDPYVDGLAAVAAFRAMGPKVSFAFDDGQGVYNMGYKYDRTILLFDELRAAGHKVYIESRPGVGHYGWIGHLDGTMALATTDGADGWTGENQAERLPQAGLFGEVIRIAFLTDFYGTTWDGPTILNGWGDEDPAITPMSRGWLFNDDTTPLWQAGDFTPMNLWSHHQAFSVVVEPTETLPGFPYVLPGSLLGDEFWENVNPDLTDVAITLASGLRLGCYVHRYDYDERTAEIFFGGFVAIEDEEVDLILHYGYPDAVTPAADAPFGQYECFHTDILEYWESGLGNDLTRYGNHLTAIGSPSVGGAVGPISGSLATTLSGSQYGYRNVVGQGVTPKYISAMVKAAAIDAIYTAVSFNNSANNTDLMSLILDGTLANNPVRAASGNVSTVSATSSAGFDSAGVWAHLAASFVSPTSRLAWYNGGSQGADTNSKTPAGLNRVTVGASFGLAALSGLAGTIAFAQSHAVERSLAWAAYEKAMLTNPASFYSLGQVVGPRAVGGAFRSSIFGGIVR